MKKFFLLAMIQGLVLLLSTPFALAADDLENSFDSLGGNKVFLERAKALRPEERTSIVQERTVSRRHRFEIAPEFSGSFGGDTYTRSRSLGINMQYHITPMWSLGVRYNHHFNVLTAEGEKMVEDAYRQYQSNPQNPNRPIPDVDYAKNESFALVNWYPIYGKLNLLDYGVAQFDVYALAGLGQVNLSSGPTSAYTLGGGVGLWFTQHFSSRLEMRWENYRAKYYDADRNLDLAIAAVQFGWIL